MCMREYSCKHAHMRVHVHACTCVVGQHLVVVGLQQHLEGLKSLVWFRV